MATRSPILTASCRLAIQVQPDLPARPIDCLYGVWQDERLLQCHPIPDVYDDVANLTVCVIADEVLNTADLAVDGVNVVAGDLSETAKFWVAFFANDKADVSASPEVRMASLSEQKFSLVVLRTLVVLYKQLKWVSNGIERPSRLASPKGRTQG
ncbi:hypothetical protein [Lichenihabitans psoromatis]|uniref:hypothetical protein n=1 Tax=Lichenihabitans psoromatis TaxID=2528642 RepID=UPI001035D848|nr:hypothetical protein [Lichenihabitans psoromatis]